MNRGLEVYFKENVGLVHTAAAKGILRLQAMGASTMDYDDLFQELSIVFVNCFTGFDANAGFKFSTYFMTSAWRRVNKLADGVANERIKHKVRSMQEMAATAGSEEDRDISETIAGDFATPEQVFGLSQSLEELERGLSPLAMKVVECAIDPPPFVEREFEAAKAHVEVASAQGRRRKSAPSISAGFVCSVLEKSGFITSSDARGVRAEIEKVSRQVFNV